MTQKELAYVEDAIGHENNIIKIVTDIINNLQDDSLVSFLESELKKHNSIKEDLMDMLEVKCNE